MSELKDIAKKLRELRDTLPSIVIDTVREAAPQLEDLVISQLDQGIDGSGNKIEPEYTPFTKSIKKLKGQPFDRVTLQDEGDFVRSIYLEISGTKADFNARDRKYPKLAAKYGDRIIDLTVESIEFAKQEILPAIALSKIQPLITR